MSQPHDSTASKPVLVVCPHCHQRIQAKREWLGQTATCKACGQRFVLAAHDGQGQVPAATASPPPAQSRPDTSSPPGTPVPPAQLPPAPARSAGQAPWPQVGDKVFTDIDGTSWWEPATVSQVLPNRYLVTIDRGQQCYTTPAHVVPLRVCTGARVVYLDEEKGGYVLGTAVKVVGDTVCVMKADRHTLWVHASTVWPEVIAPGTKMVGKNEQGQVAEMASVVWRSMQGYRLALPDGTETMWQDNELGQKLCFAPQVVSKDAPSAAPPLSSFLKDTKTLIGIGGILLFGVSWVAIPMFQPGDYCTKFSGSIVSLLLIAGVTALFSRVISPLLRLEALQYPLAGVLFGIILLMGLIGKEGGWKLGSPIWYGAVAFIGMFWGFPKPGEMNDRATEAVKSFKKDPECYGKTDIQCPYLTGERVFYFGTGDDFRRIGTVQNQSATEVTVMTADGQTLRLQRYSVCPYEVKVMERVMALHPGQGSFIPGVLVHIECETFTVRFDDWQIAGCRPADVWFIARKAATAMLGASEAKFQEVFSACDAAMGQAQAACQSGNFQAAHQVLARTLKLYPFLDDLHFGQAATYQEEKNYMMAAAEAKLAIGPMSTDPGLYTILGNANMNLKRPVEAEEAFRAALNLNPDEPGHWQNLGNALEAQGRKAEAKRCFEQSRQRGGPGA